MRIAVFICAAVVVISTYASARHNLANIADTARSAFIDGHDGSGYSIYADLQKRVALSRNFHTVASRYIDTDDPMMKALDRSSRALDGEKSPRAAFCANEDLNKAIIDLDRALMEQDLSETDESYRIGIITDLNSYEAAISHDGYNDYIRSAGADTLSQFPANLWRIITFSEPVEYFN